MKASLDSVKELRLKISLCQEIRNLSIFIFRFATIRMLLPKKCLDNLIGDDQ